jgi:hypothetical protein
MWYNISTVKERNKNRKEVIIMKKVYGYEEKAGYCYIVEPRDIKENYILIGTLSENYQLVKAESTPTKIVEGFISMLSICYNETVMANGVKESVFNPQKTFKETIKRLNEKA